MARRVARRERGQFALDEVLVAGKLGAVRGDVGRPSRRAIGRVAQQQRMDDAFRRGVRVEVAPHAAEAYHRPPVGAAPASSDPDRRFF